MMRSHTLTEVATIVIGLGLSTAAFAQADPQATPSAEPPLAAPPERAAPPPSEPTQAHEAEYVVRAGDTLGEIAKKTTGSESNWEAIARENGIDDPTKLRVGHRLRIPSELTSA